MDCPPLQAADCHRVSRRAVVATTCRVVYAPTPKVLSTSMLWLLASAEGDPAARMPASMIGAVGAHTIHDPLVHRLPALSEVSRALRREALTSSRWMRVGITRDPFARLYAAWQYKALLGTPGELKFRPPELVIDRDGNLDLGASFRAFVAFLDASWEAVMRDQHFWPQVHALAPHVIEYTHLARLDRLGDLLAALGRHAPALDRPLPRANEGLDVDYRRCYDAESAATVARLYRADFDLLGYDTTAPNSTEGPVLLGPVAQRLLAAIHHRNQRIAMVRKGAGLRWELVRQRHRLGRRLRWLRRWGRG